MKVLQLHNMHAADGGAPAVMQHEGRLLEGEGHEVQQFTLAPAEDSGLSALRAGAKAVYNVEASREVTRRIQSFHPDVVHVHTPFPLMSPSVFRAADRAGVPAVTTLHSFRYSCVAGTCVRDERICEDCVGSKLKLSGVRHACYHNSRGASAALTMGLGLHRALGTFHHSVSRYLALTDFMRRLMVRDGYPEDRIEVKPNSVPDPGVRTGGPAERNVVFAGRLIEIKGVRTLLDAWAKVPPGMRLVIAGDGPLRYLVEERAAADDSIDFRGWVSQEEVTDLMAAAEVVVVPSHWYEGAPLVILRSLGVGTPVLVSDLENLSTEILADGVGWTFRMGDASSLADALRRLHADPAAARALRAPARRAFEARYAPEVDVRRLERIYHDVIAGRKVEA